jgi:hypothetical protein
MFQRPYVREDHHLQEKETMMFEAGTAATAADVETVLKGMRADFRTPADPPAGWATRNPERAMLFLYVSPRDCGAVEEVMAI